MDVPDFEMRVEQAFDRVEVHDSILGIGLRNGDRFEMTVTMRAYGDGATADTEVVTSPVLVTRGKRRA